MAVLDTTKLYKNQTIMRKSILPNLLVCSVILLLVLESCKDDRNLAIPIPISDQSFVEQFDDLSVAKSNGWVAKNKSDPSGSGMWMQDNTGSAYSSNATSDGCVTVDFHSATNYNPYEGVISNWLISPAITMQNSDRIVFYAKTDDARWGDRMQVLVNGKNDGLDCGLGMDPGDFSIKLLDINPINATTDATNSIMLPAAFYKYNPVTAFPQSWTRFEAQVQGLSKAAKGRFAFRYYVPSGGNNGLGSKVFLDSVAYISVNHH